MKRTLETTLLMAALALGSRSARAGKPAEPAKPSKPAPAPAAADDWRKTPPRPTGKVAFKAPKLQQFKLSNGIPVWLVERHDLPLVTVQVLVRAGSEHAWSKAAGLPSLVATMLDEGTETLGPLALVEKAEGLGAQLSTGSSMESAWVQVNALSETLEPSIGLLTDVLLHPKFDPAELERVKADRLTDILQIKDSPRRLAGQLLAALMFRGTPYGLPEIGTESTIKSLTRDDVASFYRSYYVPRNMGVVVAGDVDAKRLKALLDAQLGKLENPPKGLEGGAYAFKQSLPSVHVYLVDRPGAPQSEVRVATSGLPRGSKDYALAEVANNVFGGNFAARLNMNLREKHGYSYGVYSWAQYRRDSGLMLAAGGIKAEHTSAALLEMLAEVRGMEERPPSAEELALAKNSIVLSLAGRFESNGQVAGSFGELMAFDLPPSSYDKLPAQVAKITGKQVVDFFKSTWRAHDITIVVVGPKKELEKSMQELAGADNYQLIDDAEWAKLFP